MNSRIRKKISLKRSNVKTFLFFLLFTSLLWLFIQFSKKYTQQIEVQVKYTNLPEDRVLNESSDQILKVTLNGNGFVLLSRSWDTSTLTYNMDNAVVDRNNNYYFLIDDKKVLKEKLGHSGEISRVDKEQLRVILDKVTLKKIPVVVDNMITYANGFGSIEGIQIVPDSVTARAVKSVLDTLYEIKTTPLEIKNLNTDYEKTLDLDLSSMKNRFSIDTTTVKVTIEVDKLTEGVKEIPITLVNVPADQEIKIFPKNVKVVYTVGLDQYNNINERDFTVIADYKDSTEDTSFLMLKLTKAPDYIHDVRLQENQVQFIIVK